MILVFLLIFVISCVGYFWLEMQSAILYVTNNRCPRRKMVLDNLWHTVQFFGMFSLIGVVLSVTSIEMTWIIFMAICSGMLWLIALDWYL